MADISDQLQTIAKEFAEKVDLATEELVTYLQRLVKGKTSVEALEIVSSINLEIALEMKLANAFTAYEAGIATALRHRFTTAVLPEKTIRQLLNLAKNNISSEVTKHLSSVSMQTIIDGIATNKSVAETVAAIKQQMPNPELIVNTAYSQFDNTLTTMLADELPANTKWIYIGPLDSRTRDSCRAKNGYSGVGGKTQKKILNRFGNMYDGLYRCRHGWVQRSSSPEDQGFSAEEFVE